MRLVLLALILAGCLAAPAPSGPQVAAAPDEAPTGGADAGAWSRFFELPAEQFTEGSISVAARADDRLPFLALVGFRAAADGHEWRIAATRFDGAEAVLQLDAADWLLWVVAQGDAREGVRLELDGAAAPWEDDAPATQVGYYRRGPDGESARHASRVVGADGGRVAEAVASALGLEGDSLVFVAVSYVPAAGAAKASASWLRPGGESRSERAVLSPALVQTEVATALVGPGESALRWESAGAAVASDVVFLHLAADLAGRSHRFVPHDFDPLVPVATPGAAARLVAR